jgi:hypothetical protein
MRLRTGIVAWVGVLACLAALVTVAVLRHRSDTAPSYGDPPPGDTALLDARAHDVINAWQAYQPQPVRRFLPVAPDLPQWPMVGWTRRIGHDPDPDRDRDITRSVANRRLTAAVALSNARPAPVAVLWDDGGSADTPVVSAAQALTAVLAESCAEQSCPGRALRVTGATLTSIPVRTAHGLAAAPAWLFTVADTPVRLARIAVEPDVALYPAGPMFQPGGGVYAGVGRGVPDRAGTAMSVQFTGATPGAGPCDGEYLAHIVEGTSAVVVVVQPRPRRHPNQHVLCQPAGTLRSQTVYLSGPLGDRVLLDLSQGWPVAVDRPR